MTTITTNPFPKPEKWKLLAACRGETVNLFFPPPGTGGRTYLTSGYTICRTCPVRLACLDFALTNQLHYGIWGGESQRSRKRMLSTIPIPRLDRRFHPAQAM